MLKFQSQSEGDFNYMQEGDHNKTSLLLKTTTFGEAAYLQATT